MYLKRIVDRQIELKLRAFGAINIVGAKWCGKTTTAEQFSKSSLKLQQNTRKDSLKLTAELNPMSLLNGEQPRLIDEWQDAPSLWDSIRVYCDDNPSKGHFILTGSTSKKVNTHHSGTGRISKLKMYPMSLFESNESNGTVSLSKLFSGEEKLENGCSSDLTIENLIFAACRGGWPSSILLKDREAQLKIPKDYFTQIYDVDMFKVDDVKRDKRRMKRILHSYARNISTLATNTSILSDVESNSPISDTTLADYLGVLEDLFIIEDLEAWCPPIRNKTAIRRSMKREFVDPSIAIAALGYAPDFFYTDLKTFGFIFECLCIRDLRIYSSAMRGEMSYFHDRYGLEADGVLHLQDGRYALLEFRLGSSQIDEGVKHLLKIERLIKEYNEKNKNKLRLPDLKMVVTGTEYGYLRPDGVYVIPIGCLRD